MKRREFIGIAVTGAASVAWPATASERPADQLTLLATPALLDVLRDARLVCELGARYREISPDERHVETLERTLRADSEVTPIITASLDEQLRNRVRRDFAEGRTVTLNGWIL